MNNRKPLLSIVICTLNASRYLRECFNSIAAQKNERVDLFIMDGGSTDGTLDIVKDYSEIIDYQITEKDGGVYDAMNRASNIIEDGWVLFLGADDRLMPNVIERLLLILEKHDNSRAFIYGDVYRPSSNTIYDGKFNSYKLLRRNICQQAILYPINALKKYKFNTELKINADHIINIQIFLDATFEKIYINNCIAYYEDVQDGLSRERGDVKFPTLRRQLAYCMGGIKHYLFASSIDSKEFIMKKIGFR